MPSLPPISVEDYSLVGSPRCTGKNSTSGRTEQSLGHAGQRGPQRGEGVSGGCTATESARDPSVWSQGVGERTGRRRQPRDTIFEGLQEQTRLKITTKLRRFVQVVTTASR